MSSNETESPDVAEALKQNIAAETAEATAVANVNAAALAWTLAQTMEQLEPKAEPFEVPIGSQFYRLGYLCQMLQAPPQVVREICKRAGVRMVAKFDDLPIYDGNGLLEILRYLDKLRAEHEAKQ